MCVYFGLRKKKKKAKANQYIHVIKHKTVERKFRGSKKFVNSIASNKMSWWSCQSLKAQSELPYVPKDVSHSPCICPHRLMITFFIHHHILDPVLSSIAGYIRPNVHLSLASTGHSILVSHVPQKTEWVAADPIQVLRTCLPY